MRRTNNIIDLSFHQSESPGFDNTKQVKILTQIPEQYCESPRNHIASFSQKRTKTNGFVTNIQIFLNSAVGNKLHLECKMIAEQDFYKIVFLQISM